MKKVLVFAGAGGYGVKVAYHLGTEFDVLAIVDNDTRFVDKYVGGGINV